jgi:hypothetical protein
LSDYAAHIAGDPFGHIKTCLISDHLSADFLDVLGEVDQWSLQAQGTGNGIDLVLFVIFGSDADFFEL